MTAKMKRVSIVTLIAAAGTAAFILSAQAQESPLPDLGLPITDPDDIVAVCGGDPSAGEPHFEVSCAACHTLNSDELHGVGPNLYALYGRTAGSAPGYAYSDAMQTAGAEGLVWGRDTLRAFLLDPQSVVPGTSKSPMAGMDDEAYRTDLMTYVRLTTTPPPPAPEDVTIPDTLLAMAGDAPYGEYLSAECASCHVSGQASATGVPQIDNLTREAMILALLQYRIGARDNQTMATVARQLGDEEIAALAAYFSQQQN
ncbi:c-type cytochrome [Yoonia litorea]|uniref:Cytochrome c n=1 Tax=Yoonia litorea TaxID=1123755 RepID=A0A1I6MDA4_9RHOB|nr:c-type cytochrome [Yoonia litorea]SFS13675.1 cytochrome c [Yoonia litorea]